MLSINLVVGVEGKGVYLTLAARGLEDLFFQLCCCISFLVLVGNRFRCYILTYLEYNTVVALC
jgi:hypothetical protein